MLWIKDKLSRIFLKKQPVQVPKEALEEICVFPLPNVVLIPGIVLPLHIFEERYKMMTDDILKKDRLLAMSWAKEATDGCKPNQICGAGSLSLIDKYPDGRANVVLEGQMRMQIVDVLSETPYIRALAKELPDIPFESVQKEQEYNDELRHLAHRYVFLSDEFPDDYLKYVTVFNKPHYLADFIGYHFLPTAEAKQKHLETVSQQERVEKIITFLNAQIKELEKIASLSDKTINTVKIWH